MRAGSNCGEVGRDRNTDFFGRERLASFNVNSGHDVNQGSTSHDFRQQTERCYRVCRLRVRRRHRARRVLGSPRPTWTADLD